MTGETRTPSPIRSVSRASPATTVQASVVGLPARTREARVVVGAEERLDAVRLGALGDRDVVAVAEALLRLEHEGEAHRVLPVVHDC